MRAITMLSLDCRGEARGSSIQERVRGQSILSHAVLTYRRIASRLTSLETQCPSTRAYSLYK